MDQDAKMEHLLEMLRRAAAQLPEEEAENAERILSKKLLRKKLKSELEMKDMDSLGDDLKANCGLISDVMGKTLEGQPGSIEHKQRLWEVFDKWLDVMEKEYGFSISHPLRPVLESEDGTIPMTARRRITTSRNILCISRWMRMETQRAIVLRSE